VTGKDERPDDDHAATDRDDGYQNLSEVWSSRKQSEQHHHHHHHYHYHQSQHHQQQQQQQAGRALVIDDDDGARSSTVQYATIVCVSSDAGTVRLSSCLLSPPRYLAIYSDQWHDLYVRAPKEKRLELLTPHL